MQADVAERHERYCSVAEEEASDSRRPAEDERSEPQGDVAGREGDLAAEPCPPDDDDMVAGSRRVRPLAGWRLFTWNLQRIGGVAQLGTVIDSIGHEDLDWSCLAFQEGGSVWAPADGLGTGDPCVHARTPLLGDS